MADIFLSGGELLVLLIFFIFMYSFIYRKSFFHYIDKFYIELVFSIMRSFLLTYIFLILVRRKFIFLSLGLLYIEDYIKEVLLG